MNTAIMGNLDNLLLQMKRVPQDPVKMAQNELEALNGCLNTVRQYRAEISDSLDRIQVMKRMYNMEDE